MQCIKKKTKDKLIPAVKASPTTYNFKHPHHSSKFTKQMLKTIYGEVSDVLDPPARGLSASVSPQADGHPWLWWVWYWWGGCRGDSPGYCWMEHFSIGKRQESLCQVSLDWRMLSEDMINEYRIIRIIDRVHCRNLFPLSKINTIKQALELPGLKTTD